MLKPPALRTLDAVNLAEARRAAKLLFRRGQKTLQRIGLIPIDSRIVNSVVCAQRTSGRGDLRQAFAGGGNRCQTQRLVSALNAIPG